MANERLRRAILDGGFSTLDVAMEVGTDAKTVERWITNGRIPHPRQGRAGIESAGECQSDLLAARKLRQDSCHNGALCLLSCSDLAPGGSDVICRPRDGRHGRCGAIRRAC